jgi:hypothetical protein
VAKRTPGSGKKNAAEKKAKVKAAPAPTIPRAPLARSGYDAQRPMRELLLLSAIESLRTDQTRGPKMSAWKVEDAELFDAAKRYCLHFETQDEVVAEAKPDLEVAGVSGRALKTWLRAVHKRFKQVDHEATKKMLDSGEISRMSVEQVDQQHLLQTKINTKLLAAIEELDLVGGDIKRLHVLSRWLGQGAEVAKIRADAQLKAEQAKLAEAKANRLTEKVAAVAAKLAEASSRGGKGGMSIAQASEILRLAIAGEDPKVHARAEVAA